MKEKLIAEAKRLHTLYGSYLGTTVFRKERRRYFRIINILTERYKTWTF